MKVTIEIDCTPQEARTFFGLPDLTDVNAKMVDIAGSRMEELAKSMAPEELMKNWMSSGLGAQEQFLKAMTAGFKARS